MPALAARLFVVALTTVTGCSEPEPVGLSSRPASPDAGAPMPDAERMARLSALGYVGVVQQDPASRSGLVRRDPQRSTAGVTALAQRNGAPAVHLYGPDGSLAHSIHVAPVSGSAVLWAEIAGDGKLLVSGRRYLLKADWSGRTLWEAPRRIYHHGFAQGPDGRIYAMALRRRESVFGGRTLSFLDDAIVVLEADGRLVHEISIFDLLGPDSIDPRILDAIDRYQKGDRPGSEYLTEELGIDNPFDVFHLNSVQVLHTAIGDARRGDLLISLRTLNLVLAVAADGSEVRWRWDNGKDRLERPHAPMQLDGGNLLVFDNGWFRGWSRVIEVDRNSGDIVWEYRGSPPASFYTRRGGLAQVLPGGNLLVTQSDSGRVFEITRDGDVVWDFWNPRRYQGQRLTNYRAWRWTPPDLDRATDLPDALRATLRTAPAPGDG